jgi:hypothetical protein
MKAQRIESAYAFTPENAQEEAVLEAVFSAVIPSDWKPTPPSADQVVSLSGSSARQHAPPPLSDAKPTQPEAEV